MIGRMQHYLNPEKEKEQSSIEKNKQLHQGLKSIGKTLIKGKWGKKYKKNMEALLSQAYIPLKAEEFMAIQFFGIIVGAITAFIIMQGIGFGIIGGVVGCFMPNIYIARKKKRRLKNIDQQLTDAIVLISNSLKAGYSFLQAVEAASKELPPPISEEFAHALKEMNLGFTTEAALENISKRVQSKDLELVVMAVLIQRQIGGNLSEILDNISETIRSRITIKGEIRTLTAQGRISGLVISLLPITLGGALYLMNPSYIIVLFIHPLGHMMLGIGIVMQMVGIYSIRKIIRIEV